MGNLMIENISTTSKLVYMFDYLSNKVTPTEELKLDAVIHDNVIVNQTEQILANPIIKNHDCIEGVGCKIGGSFSQNNF